MLATEDSQLPRCIPSTPMETSTRLKFLFQVHLIYFSVVFPGLLDNDLHDMVV